MDDHLQAHWATSPRSSLNWTYLGAITQGVSAIDLGALALRHLDDAHQFAREYGYDLDEPLVRRYVAGIQQEALAFVRETFLAPEQHHCIPAEVAQPEDPSQLLLLASQRVHRHDPTRLWACALLKVMHGLFYIDNNLKLRYFEAIRQQVFASLDTVIRTAPDGSQWLADDRQCLPLVHLDRKRNKSRHSILLKLLQKPEYVAADIHDHLGVRLTLPTRIECLLALELLRRAHIISVINLEAGRTRNTLLDLVAAKDIFKRYRALLERSTSYPHELIQRMERELALAAQAQTRTDNPHSGAGFNSLQVTVRKMIHLPPDVTVPHSASGDEGVSFFFAYEIQLMDAASHDRSQVGPASHEAYKRRQIETARRRVLGPELARS